MPSNTLRQAPVPGPIGFSPGIRTSAEDRGSIGGSAYRQPAACRAVGSTGTLCLFAIAIAILLWIPRSPIARTVPAAPLAVTFELAPAPSAPPAPPVDVPAGPVQHVQETARADGAERELDPIAPVLPKIPALPTTTAPAAGTTEQASSQARPVERTAAPPAMTDPGTTLAARVTSASAERAALANWQSQLLGHLKTHLRFPRQAERSRQQGVALVSVRVDRQGRVLHARIERGSGYPMLDSEALATVHRGSPVPPPTADVRGDPVTVTIPIQFALRR